MSFLTSPTRDQAIWECALECALRREMYGRCSYEFDCEQCQDCKFFIRQYMQTDEASLKLYMLQAESEVCGLVLARRSRDRWYTFLLVIFLLLAFHFWKGEQQQSTKSKQSYITQRQTQQSAETTIQRTVEAGIEHDNIVKTLHRVANDLNKGIDVNKDGKVNCIDAAVLFYQYYPDKQKVCIESNSDMNHLFNCVMIDGIWKAIEPQVARSGHNSYWMRDVWGNDYDNKYNYDRTNYYKKYAKEVK